MKSTLETRETAQKVLDYIAEHPEEHSQAYFCHTDDICGTTMCIAGTAAYVTGGNDLITQIRFAPVERNWEQEAGPLLGLDLAEAFALFYCMDDAAAIDATRAIANGDEEKFWDAINNADE